MTVRRAMLLAHRWSGLATALFLLLAAATGCLLVFRAELDLALNPELFAAPPGPALPGPELATRLLAAHPGWTLRSFPVRSRPGHAFPVAIAPADVSVRGHLVRDAEDLFLDPRNAAILGARADALGLDRAHLVGTILAFHYSLLAGRPGEWLMEAVALAWLVLTLLGVVVTWPRRAPRLRHWVRAWTVTRAGLRTRPLIELHRAAGLWLLLPLLALAATSVAFNAYFDVFVPVLERLSPPRAGGPADHVPFPAAPSAIPRPIGFVAALAAAERVAATELPALSPATLGDAGSRGYAVRFSPGGTLLDEYAGPATIFVGRFDGRPLWIDRPSLDGWGRIAERAVYSLHSGQVLGWPTRLLVLALGLATVGFTVTGVLPWWRRTRRRSAASRPPTMSRR